MRSYLLICAAIMSAALLSACAQHNGPTPSLSENTRNTGPLPPPSEYHASGLIQSSTMAAPTRP